MVAFGGVDTLRGDKKKEAIDPNPRPPPPPPPLCHLRNDCTNYYIPSTILEGQVHRHPSLCVVEKRLQQMERNLPPQSVAQRAPRPCSCEV